MSRGGASCVGHGEMMGISPLGVREHMASLEAGEQLAPSGVGEQLAPSEVG